MSLHLDIFQKVTKTIHLNLGLYLSGINCLYTS